MAFCFGLLFLDIPLLIILAIFILSYGIGVFFFLSYFGLICFSAYDTIRYDTTFFFLLFSHHFRGILIFLQVGRFLVGWFMGGLRALYVLVTTDGLMTICFLLFYVGFLVFVSLAVLLFFLLFFGRFLNALFLVFFGVFLGGSYFIFVSGGAQSVRWSVRREDTRPGLSG